MSHDNTPPTVISTAITCDNDPAVEIAAPRNRQSVIIRNLAGGADAYVGGSDVTTANGFPLAQGESISIDGSGAVYAVTASGTASFRVLETAW